MIEAAIVDYIKREEGRGKTFLYKDHLGFWTLGWGHLVPAKYQKTPKLYLDMLRSQHSLEPSNDEGLAEALILRDVLTHINDVAKRVAPAYDRQRLSVRMVLASMAFQFGGKLFGYRTTRAFMEAENWAGLAKSLSSWKAHKDKQTRPRMLRNQVLLSMNTNREVKINAALNCLFDVRF